MKKKLQSYTFIFKMILLVSCFVLAMLHNQSMAAEVSTVPHTSNRVSVNFKHDILKNELAISVTSATEAIMQLFIFSPDGILVKEVAVCAHKTTTIKGINKGYYLYECFNKDERMKSGSLFIK